MASMSAMAILQQLTRTLVTVFPEVTKYKPNEQGRESLAFTDADVISFVT